MVEGTVLWKVRYKGLVGTGKVTVEGTVQGTYGTRDGTVQGTVQYRARYVWKVCYKGTCRYNTIQYNNVIYRERSINHIIVLYCIVFTKRPGALTQLAVICCVK